MGGLFRLKTPQSHTRFEGEGNKQRVVYYGDGHAKAPIGGDRIVLTDAELRAFDKRGHKPRTRFELIEGEWHDTPDTFNAETAGDIPTPDDIDKLLANKVDIIVGELDVFDEGDLQEILARETGEFGKSRKGVIEAVEALLG